jgi:hypothetical protein
MDEVFLYKKLKFNIAPYDGMLEASLAPDKFYIIYQNGCGGPYKATFNGTDLLDGDIYECLDACNEHYNEIKSQGLQLDVVLAGCTYTKVDKIAFKDHNNEDAAVMDRRFSSIEEARNFIKDHNKEAIVYVYDMRERSEITGPKYWLKCGIRRK